MDLLRGLGSNTGTIGMYRDSSIVTIIPGGHYSWVGHQPNPTLPKPQTPQCSVFGVQGLAINSVDRVGALPCCNGEVCVCVCAAGTRKFIALGLKYSAHLLIDF